MVELLDKIDTDNFILAPGCDMPYDVPAENIVGVVQAVRDPEGTRVMLANYHAESLDLDSVQLPDYGALEQPWSKSSPLTPIPARLVAT